MSAEENPYAAWERNFREQMLRLRESRQMTQTDLARSLKGFGLPFHQQTVQRIEAGERPVRLDEAHLIAQVLNADLNTMTASGTPSTRELRYAVDRVRRAASTEASNVSDTIDNWLDDLEVLVLDVSERKASQTAGTVDPVTRWGLEWATRAWEIYAQLYNAWAELQRFSGVEDSDISRTDDSMDTVEKWIEPYHDAAWAAMESEELYESLPDEENG